MVNTLVCSKMSILIVTTIKITNFLEHLMYEKHCSCNLTSWTSFPFIFEKREAENHSPCVVVQSLSCVRLCYPMNCSTPDSSFLHYLLEFAQIHVHIVSDAIQPSHHSPNIKSRPFGADLIPLPLPLTVFCRTSKGW